MQLSWVPDTGAAIGPTNTRAAKPNAPGSYRILLSLGDLAFAQGKFSPPKSRLDASLVLFHDSLQLDSLRLAALDQTLTLKGTLTDFAHPAWQGQASGQVDMRVLAPYTGFFFVREGVVRLNATASGRGSEFGMTGDLASDSVHYRDPFVDAQSTLTARFRADAKQLLISDVHTRLTQGGQVDGEFQFDNWLDFTPAPAAQLALRRAHKSWPVPTGVVRASLKGVTLDTILTMLAAPPYRHLGAGCRRFGSRDCPMDRSCAGSCHRRSTGACAFRHGHPRGSSGAGLCGRNLSCGCRVGGCSRDGCESAAQPGSG